MKYFLLVFALNFLLIDSLLAQESCGTVDLNGVLGQIRNQSDVGWCFANTAADLLTASYSSELRESANSLAQQDGIVDLAKAQVSSMYAALIYYDAQIAKDPKNHVIFGEGGLVYDSIMLAQDRGFLCSHQFDRDLMQRGFSTSLSGKLKVFQKLYELNQDFLKTQSEDIYSKLYAYAKEILNANSVLKDIPVDTIREALNEPAFDRATMKLMQIACESSKVPIKKKYSYRRLFDYTEKDVVKTYDPVNGLFLNRSIYSNEIDISLNRKNPKPVGLTYQVESILADEKYASGPHASVISGRKMINGVCQYQIRNSWGTSCTRKILSDNQLVDVPIYKDKYPCEVGTIWVNKTDLNKFVSEVVYQN